MKNNFLNKAFILCLTATLSIASAHTTFANVSKAIEAPSTIAFAIPLIEGEVNVINDSDIKIKSGKFEPLKKEDTEEIIGLNIVMKEEDGTIHIFEDVKTEIWKEPLITLEISENKLCIKFIDVEEKECVIKEAKEKNLQKN